MNDENDSGSFTIKDRRLFTEEGELKAEPPDAAPSVSASAEPEVPSVGGDDSAGAPGATPPMDFASFVLSLATTGMVHLGQIPDPAVGQKRENLDGAKQLIEILSMLKEKTQGNLSPEEGKLLEDLLHELRLAFLSKSKTIRL